ncbi:MAG: PAS-domain containing protein [Rhodobiaceae bacterium]|nr:PAS-domain containing protein [Rhodobiaceae bacterium]
MAGDPASQSILADAATRVSPHDVIFTSMALGAIVFGVITGVLYVRTRMRAAAERARMEAEAGDLRHRVDRAEALLAAEDAVVISWATNGRAEVVGNLSGLSNESRNASALLDFPGWLRAASAEELTRAIEQLRARGEPFNRILYRTDGTPVEADGRIRAGRAILRLRHAYGQRAVQGAIESERDRLRREIDAMRDLIRQVKTAAWVRDNTGAVVWANEAYAALSRRFFNGESSEGRDLMRVAAMSGPAPQSVLARFPQGVATAELSLKIDDRIEVFDLVEYAFEGGAFGVAEKRTGRETEKASRTPASFRTFNQLGTGIALFNADHRLIFANDAFRSLFEIEERWTMPGVDHGQILDSLREGQYLPLEVDYRSWKSARLEAYRADRTTVEHWHLPDGRTIRVIADPQPDGGLACLFDDETERLTLESRFNSLMRIQRETLENMREAVSVFSSDGRLDFSNPAFASLWKLAPDRIAGRPHIENVIFACKSLYDDDETWTALRHAVTDVADSRAALNGRMKLDDGRTVEYATMPLPDGATLVTYADISDQVAGERMLQDRNEALEAAAKLKNSFIQHVSYELRTPLTSVIGFAELLGEESTGPLEPRQAEYVEHILSSSGSLLAIIDNILDLATIDAGAMELEYGKVDLYKAIEAAANGVRDRLKEAGLRLQVRIQEGLTAFEADESRVRQVLYNLLSNAIGFSEKGQTITLVCDKVGTAIRFIVEDHGRGIAPEDLDQIFDRFVSRSAGTDHRGAGLGLSMVKSFVELHGGLVAITSEPGEGTTVSCVFPLRRGEKLPDALSGPDAAKRTGAATEDAG